MFKRFLAAVSLGGMGICLLCLAIITGPSRSEAQRTPVLRSLSLAQEPTAGTTVSEPVPPLSVKVPTSPEPPPPSKLVPEGEPLPTARPPLPVPVPDPFIQSSSLPISKAIQLRAIALLSGPIVNFPGLTSGSQPPDVTGAVGRNHFVEMLNATQFLVWDKQGNSLAGPTNFGNLWPMGSLCRLNEGDPIVVYDHLADRWLLSQFFSNGFDANNNALPPFGMCVAISQTPNPAAGTWFLYTFTTDRFPDYPKFGVWPDGYYMSSYEGLNLGVFVFDRANMLLGNAAGFIKTTISSLTPAAGVRNTRILPANLVGPPPPAGTPNFFVRPVDSQQDTGNPTDRIEVYEAQVNWTSNSFTFTLVNTLSPAAFNIMVCDRNGTGGMLAFRDCIPEPNTTATVDALSNRPMMQLNYRTFGSSESLIFNQTINVSGALPLPLVPAHEVAGVRWYELQNAGAGWTIRQQGTYAPQPLNATAEDQLLHYWMGSAAEDAMGNIAVGYSIDNDDDNNPVYPSIRYTGRRFDDPLNLLPQAEQVILNGTTSLGGNGSFGNRWGDYSQMTVDPVDDCTFWYAQMVAGGATQIASFGFDTCAADLAITKTGSPDPVTVGSNLIYTIEVTNNGPVTAQSVTVTDDLPAETTFVSCSSTGGGVCGGLGNNRTVTFATLTSGQSETITLVANVSCSVADGTAISNTATVSSFTPDPDPSNNSAYHHCSGSGSVGSLATKSQDGECDREL